MNLAAEHIALGVVAAILVLRLPVWQAALAGGAAWFFMGPDSRRAAVDFAGELPSGADLGLPTIELDAIELNVGA